MTTPRSALGLGGFILTVLIANWLVGPIALIVAWLIVLVVVVAAAISSPGRRGRWILVTVAVLLVGLPILVVLELSTGSSTLILFG
jgi:hypothetical protein